METTEEFSESSLATVDEIGKKSSTDMAMPATLPISPMLIRLARENPRDEEQVFSRVMRELEQHPAYAEDVFYSIPYKDKSGDEGKKVAMVEGLTIKAAMTIFSRWGNSANGVWIADDREDRVIVQGIFVDYETLGFTLKTLPVSKWFKTRDRGTIKLDATRLNNAIIATGSKAVRNAILHPIPSYIKDDYFAFAKQLVINPPVKAGQKAESIQERIQKGINILVTKFGATKEEVENLIGNWIADTDGTLREDEVLSRLLGLKNAIKDKHITVEAAMGRQDKAAASMPQSKKETANGGPTPPTKA